ncbi:short chain dehydrogenase [Neohortaea acidophila]|uniref:Short chain dehydrogenase n=1 Tax=Neohortaea acidophila TaxID=245834 RepID=A0A6A6Q1T8_9PEZI|nr:short chain dehydrogenase [Neohortaea acidophila]KAF2485949.1 short chain dehydrogenase [Neohortaea acidophila]
MSAIYPSLANKIICITGGAEGIAAAAVELFCNQGSRVIFFDISNTSAETLIAKIQSKKDLEGANSRTRIPVFFRCDVTDLASLRASAQHVLNEYGGVDVLVNSAASAGASSRVPSAEVTPESWEADMNVNLRHVFFLTQAIVPAMQRQRSGSVINMGSITWRIPASGIPIYTAAKAAIMGLTRTHAKEFGPYGIRVNSVMPGAIATERQINEVLTPEYRAEVMRNQSLQRDLMPREVASVILFLASEDSSAVTGSSYVVDGGWVSDP